jgi:hypothetical protein
METPMWKLYAEGVQFVLANRPIVGSILITKQSWETLLLGIFQYQEIEDLVVDIVVIMDGSMKRNQYYQQVYDLMIYSQSTAQNRASLTRILLKFAGNPDIEPTLMQVLSDMCKSPNNEPITEQLYPPAFDVQIELAIASIRLAIRNRSEKCVLPALDLLTFMCVQHHLQLCATLEKDNHDIVLMMLEVLETFNKYGDVVWACSRISTFFMGTWTAPTPPPPHAIIDRILSCMQEYPGCVHRQRIGCQQLRNMCMCNGRDSKYSPETMLCVVNFIKQFQHDRASLDMYDERVCNLWTFVNEVMRNINTYNECVHLFSVEFLQTALACNFGTYEDILEDDRVTMTVDCVQFICSLLQRILTSRPMEMAAFVRQDGISGLVKIAHHHIKPNLASQYTQRFAGNIGCVDLLLDILENQDANAIKLFTISLLGGRKIERKFSTGILDKNKNPTTLCTLLVQSLDFQPYSDYDNIDFSVARICKKIQILSFASEERNIVCNAMLPYMRRFLAFVLCFINRIQRDMSNQARRILKPLVANYDNFIINVYTAISTDCIRDIYSLWNTTELAEYKDVSYAYRDRRSTFNTTILKITKALGENSHKVGMT